MVDLSFLKQLDLFKRPIQFTQQTKTTTNRKNYSKYTGSYLGFFLSLIMIFLLMIYMKYNIERVISGEFDWYSENIINPGYNDDKVIINKTDDPLKNFKPMIGFEFFDHIEEINIENYTNEVKNVFDIKEKVNKKASLEL